MKKPIIYPKKTQKKPQNNKSITNFDKKTTSIEENNSNLLKFFSLQINTSTNKVDPPRRQVANQLKHDKTDPNKDYRLSHFNFYESKKKKKPSIKKFLKKKIGKDDTINKIDISSFVFFSEKFSKDIRNIFENNFLHNFKRYLTNVFPSDKKNIGPRQDLNISIEPFNKFVHQIFKQFITKYLLNTYHNLVFISQKYMIEQTKTNNYSEVELLSCNDKPNIYLEYLPINLPESKLFYPELTKIIVRFIKNFRKKRRKKLENKALLLFRPNNDFITYINKIRLICTQLGYNLLIKEDEVNKLISFEKLKLINQNYIIGSLKDKNKKYLQIIDSASTTKKWAQFLQTNDMYDLIEQEEEKFYRMNKNRTQRQNSSRNKYKKISKSQSTINTTQDLSKKLLENRIKANKSEEALSNTMLTFIGHNSTDEINSQENEQANNSKEFVIAKNYEQNILEKFNKRKNVILFVDNFEENEDNIKYLSQINSMIPNSKSPIIILTNNLSLFNNSNNNSNPVITNNNFQTRYIPYQIGNEGINNKENIIYITFLIIYFISFFPKAELKKDEEEDSKNNNNTDEKNDIEINIIHITDNDEENHEEKLNDIINNNNYNYNLDRIIKEINSVYIDTKFKIFDNNVYSSFITLSYIIAIKNNYELDNILVYLKNLFQFMEKQFKDNNIKQNALSIISLIKNKVLEEIEEYQIKDDIDSNNEDLGKLNDICENNSFSDYEYGMIYNSAENDYENKLKNYGINLGVDYNKESYFYLNEFFGEHFKDKKMFNYISNKEIEERIIEDHKFYQSYYSSNINLNHSDVIKINMILTQIIFNERISSEDTSKFIGTRKRNNSKRNNNSIKEIDPNIYLQKEKINLLNKIFRKCNGDIFTKYINAHYGFKYFVEFVIDNKKYFIPDKLLFFNYFNDNYLMEKIQSEFKIKYSEKEEEDEEDDLDLNDCEEEFEEEEEEDY